MFTISSSSEKFDFKNLFVFEMANNHQGSVDHGLAIIREIAAIAREFGIRAGVKLQFRDLDTFIHPAFVSDTTNKHIPRFLSTRLSREQFKIMVDEIHAQGLISICTPFDEISVDVIAALGIQIIKVASCSATDWPLLGKIASAGKPVICSTAGLPLSGVDKIVSFFGHRGTDFALMHCVALYPTPSEKLHLHRIELFRRRYPGITVGFSTHEDPNNTSAVQMAYAKGARMFEKHVGLSTDTITLNTYSASPSQVRQWLKHYQEAADSCNEVGADSVDVDEARSLRELSRGVYFKSAFSRGTTITKDDVYYAMPLLPGQLSSGAWWNQIVLDRDCQKDDAVSSTLVSDRPARQAIISSAIHEVKGMLNEANIPVGYDFSSELSHHYGLENFRAYGAFIITSINREYCKKLIVQLPGQVHPMHYHHTKEETFQVLYGDLEVRIDDRVRKLHPGDILLVPRGVFHGFSSVSGAIFEEVSTTHVKNDSFYADKKISVLPLEARKTQLVHWGFGNFDE